VLIWKEKKLLQVVTKFTKIWEVQYQMGENLKSCLGRVFHFKLGSFASKQQKWLGYIQQLLELKTWPRFYSVNWSLSMENSLRLMGLFHRQLIKDRHFIDPACLPCFGWVVMLLATAWLLRYNPVQKVNFIVPFTI
jgi:hypothetical protein